MAYVTTFKHDVFISYSRDNNYGGDNGWVTRLHKRLEDELKEHTSRDLRIWRDEERVDRNEEFEKVIQRAAETSAVFLAVNSRAYWRSNYCQREIDCFDSRTREDGIGPTVGNCKRIFNIRYDDVVPFSEWPESIQGAEGFQFYEKPVGSSVAFRLEHGRDKFDKEFKKLLSALSKTLEAMKDHAGDPSRPVTRFTIFLAETSEKLRNTLRKRIASELKANGIELTGDAPLLSAAEHDKEAIRLIRQADLSVHLFDESPGREVDDLPNKYYSQRQAELSLKYAKAGMMFVPRRLNNERIEDADYRGFLSCLERRARNGDDGSFNFDETPDTLASANYQFIGEEATAEEIVSMILSELDKLAQEGANLSSSSVLLDSHEDDLPYTVPISSLLVERKYEPIFSTFRDSPRENVEGLLRKLKAAGGFVLVFGGVDRTRIESRFIEAIKMSLDHERRTKSSGIYFSPQHDLNKEKFDFGTVSVHQFDGSDLDTDLIEWIKSNWPKS